MAFHVDHTKTDGQSVVQDATTKALTPSDKGGVFPGNARGARASDFQQTRATAVRVASGVESFIGAGAENRVTSLQGATVGGRLLDVTGQRAIAGGGDSNLISALRSAALGGFTNDLQSTAIDAGALGGNANIIRGQRAAHLGGQSNESSTEGTNAVVHGIGTNASRFNEYAHGASSAEGAGTIQASRVIASRDTTSEALTELFLDGLAKRLTLPGHTTLLCNIRIVGRAAGGADYAAWTINNVLISRTSGVPTVTNGVANLLTSGATAPNFAQAVGANAMLWEVTVDSDGIDSLRIQVEGTSALNVSWCAVVEFVQLIRDAT